MMKNTWLLVLFMFLVFAYPGHAANDASMMSQSVSSSMYAGRTYSILLAMTNTGTTAWTAASGYRLGSQNPQDNVNWGLNRVNLSASDSIAPGSFKMFSFMVTAPSTPGTYNFQWKMIQGSSWFGSSSDNVVVTVMPSPVSTSSTVPATTTTSTTTSTTTRATTTTTTSTTKPTTTTTTSTTTSTMPSCSSSASQSLSVGDNAIEFQTPHDYPGNMSCSSGTYTCPPGYLGKIYARYDTETWYDYFVINDAVSGNGAPYSGNSSGYVWIIPPGQINSLWFSFSSDLTGNRWGVDVDVINCYVGTTTTSTTSTTVYETTTSTTSTTTTTVFSECTASDDSYLTLGINAVIYKTPHDYPGPIDCYSGTYSCPPRFLARTHARYETQPGHGLLYASDPSAGNETSYSGDSGGYLWLDPGYGTVRLRYTSDGTSQWGVDVDVIECYDNSTTTTTSSTTTTSLPGKCTMKGNEPPCDVISLDEIVDSINQWAQGSYTLKEVVDLINSWGDPAGYPAT